MVQEVAKPKLSFNQASTGNEPDENTMALMIDLQQGVLQYLKREEAEAYLDHMKKVLDDLRMRKIPIGWVTIGDVKNDLHEPEKGNSERRDVDTELRDLGFFGNERHEGLFQAFLKTHGPRKDELIFRKEGCSALSDEEPDLKNYLAEQRIKNVILSGGMAAYCVGSTICDAVRKGYKTIVPTDTVIGWPGGKRGANYMLEGATWLDEDHAFRILEEYGDMGESVKFGDYEDFFPSIKNPCPGLEVKTGLDFN